MYYIYRITNLVNGKTYIGQHKFYLNKNDYYKGSGKRLILAYKKYGIENFKKEILEVVPTKFEVNVLERYYIAKERERVGVENCYNLADGGDGTDGVVRSEEYRKKMSVSKKNISDETRKKMSESHKGKSPANKGIQMSEEQKKKLSEVKKGQTAWNKGKHHSEETKKKLSEISKGKHWYNNGKVNRYCYECPEGFVPGRLI